MSQITALCQTIYSQYMLENTSRIKSCGITIVSCSINLI